MQHLIDVMEGDRNNIKLNLHLIFSKLAVN